MFVAQSHLSLLPIGLREAEVEVEIEVVVLIDAVHIGVRKPATVTEEQVGQVVVDLQVLAKAKSRAWVRQTKEG